MLGLWHDIWARRSKIELSIVGHGRSGIVGIDEVVVVKGLGHAVRHAILLVVGAVEGE
jgi:hypothetical protein